MRWIWIKTKSSIFFFHFSPHTSAAQKYNEAPPAEELQLGALQLASFTEFI